MCIRDRYQRRVRAHKAEMKPIVVIVLGGPGAGKGTQCQLVASTFGFVHLSAGELLRKEVEKGSPEGEMINNMMKEGQIVPSSVTVKLLQNEVFASHGSRFLIDGFPRNQENNQAFEALLRDQIVLARVLHFECPEDILLERLKGRGVASGRLDDNEETVRKRFGVFKQQTLPILEHYTKQDLVTTIVANKTIDEVFNGQIRPLIEDLLKKFETN
eukprot:TRINITY_DN922_c0_g1_i1.p1 TRINITY_DN922_c0_g1~~TRINITY_DN922_c0_g1_i1.p1  ORF type:complete len:215 (-),score=83.62 TRINITY_DN922_c0_g1_i1:61-705(-)